jgi:hypothetical protein
MTRRHCNFELVRPCAKCPFRRDVPGYLRPGRVAEIATGLERGTFDCHMAPKNNPQHCAGALILLEKKGQPSQMMRIAERLGLYVRDRLRGFDIVFNNFTEMTRHMVEAGMDQTYTRRPPPTDGVNVDLPQEMADVEDDHSRADIRPDSHAAQTLDGTQ